MKITLTILILFTIMVLAACERQPSLAPKNESQDLSTSRVEPPKEKLLATIDGIVTDSMCGMSHTGMLKTGSMGNTESSCALKCVEAGSQFVLAEPSTGALYRLSDQKAAKPFAGKKVRVTGYIHKNSKLIEVNAFAQLP